MRWDVLDPGSLDTAVAALRERGLPVFALLEPWEEDDFRRRFAGRRTLDALTAPVARTADDAARLYALAPHALTAAPPTVMPSIDDGCVDASPHFVYPDAQRRLAAR
jgi:hypothetical protein